MNISPFYFTYIKNDPRHAQFQIFSAPSFFSIINKLKKHKPYCVPFLFPVKKKDAPNYYEIIKNPMDLNTMLKKAERDEYRNKGELKNDIFLMAENCRTYNGSGLIVEYGDEMLKYGNFLIENIQEQEIKEEKIEIIKNDELPYVKNHFFMENDNWEMLFKMWIGKCLLRNFKYCRKECLNIVADVMKFIISREIRRIKKK